MNTINPELGKVFFDTHANVKKLRVAGFTEQQAEVQTEILSQLIKDDLVTKNYFAVKMKELDGRLRELEARLKAEIIKWVAGLLLAQTGIIVALIKLLPSIPS